MAIKELSYNKTKVTCMGGEGAALTCCHLLESKLQDTELIKNKQDPSRNVWYFNTEIWKGQTWRKPRLPHSNIYNQHTANSLIFLIYLDMESLRTQAFKGYRKKNFTAGTQDSPSLVMSFNFKLRVLNRSREYCLDAFLQSVPAFIIAANSS